MSYGWLTESTLFGKKEKVIELGKDKLFNESKDNKKSENSIDQLNGIVNSYLQNVKESKKNQLGRKKLSYEDKLYNAKNDGVEKRNKQDRKDTSVKKQINKVKKYEELKRGGRNDPKCLVNFESKKQMESELEEIRKLKAQRNGENIHGEAPFEHAYSCVDRRDYPVSPKEFQKGENPLSAPCAAFQPLLYPIDKMNNHSVYNKFNSTLSVFNNNSNLNSSVYISGDKKSKSRTSLNALSFYKSSASVYVKKVDKTDKKENVKTLIRYLGWKNYSGSISPNLFKNPSMTDLINIWNFIFKHVDPQIEVNKDNYGEVVLSFYKDIGYPYTISKSTLVAPTTGLQYNTHLSALAWLCQLLIFEAECFNDINEEKDMNCSYDFNEDGEIKMEDFILQSYKSYINKEEKNANDVLNAKLDKEIDRLQNDVSAKSEDIVEKKKKIEEIKNHMKENEELIKRNKVLCEENKKIKLLYTNSLEETKKLEKEIEMCKKANQEEKVKTEKIVEQINKVKEILQKQTLNKAQFLQMNEDIEKNKEKIEQIKNEIKSLNNEHPTLSEKLNNRNSDLKKLAKSVNEKLSDILQNLNLYRNISSSEWNKINNVSINIDSFTVDNMLNLNWKDTKSDVKSFIEADQEEMKNSLRLIEDYEKRIKLLEEEIDDLKENIQDSEARVKKLNDDTDKFVTASSDKFTRIVAQNEKMLNEAKEKSDKANEMLKEIIAEKEEKENEFSKIKTDNEKMFKEKLASLQQACAHLVELKMYSKNYASIVLDEKKRELELYKELHKSVVE